MNKYKVGFVSGACMLSIASFAAAAASSPLQCAAGSRVATAQGKVMNNLLSEKETLGVLHLALDGTTKIKCGIHGVKTEDGLGFTHSMVCDDSVRVAPFTSVHSQMVLDTRIIATQLQSCGVGDMVYGTFQEISDPIPGAGRGRFAATGGGRIFVNGTVNCAGAVDMEFYGTVCVKQ